MYDEDKWLMRTTRRAWNKLHPNEQFSAKDWRAYHGVESVPRPTAPPLPRKRAYIPKAKRAEKAAKDKARRAAKRAERFAHFTPEWKWHTQLLEQIAVPPPVHYEIKD